MGFLTSLFGGAGNSILTIGLALAIVLILIVLGVWALKLIFKATDNVRRGRNKRLLIIDTAVVDQKRQLILIRRDNVEHLVMTGSGQDLLIETGIEPPAEQAQPTRTKRRQPVQAAKPNERMRKARQRPERNNLPKAAPSEPEVRATPPRPKIVPPEVTNIQPDESFPEPSVEAFDSSEISSATGQSALEKLSKLTRPKGDGQTTSLRHTGLLRSVNRTEPTINPQPSNNVSQISEAERTDSAKSQRKPAKRKQGAVTSDDETKRGKVSGNPDETGSDPKNKTGKTR